LSPPVARQWSTSPSFTSDNAYVIAADEDFDATTLRGRNVDDGTTINASQGSGTRKLAAGATLTGVSVFAGRACNGDTAVAAGSPTVVDVAVVERGVCTFTEKVANVIKAGGYDAVLVFNRTGTDACDNGLSMDVQGDIPTFGVAPRSQGFAIFDVAYDNGACLSGTGPTRLPVAVGETGDTVTFTAFYDGWGYVHLYRNGSGKLTELDTYAVPQAHDPAFAYDFGDLSIHEVATSAVDPKLAYYSYYAAGFRVTKIVRNQLVEVGHFIDQGGSNFWGVETFQHGGKEYVAASDRDHGLYIFRYTGK
ncbi:MAG TPA: PA domain-containing protein, partial [Gaiellaceae bacterium]|nr:PA domain-containing protein [Gaiellaceae bacterium]